MLRDYQKSAVDMIRALFGSGHKKVLLHLATGSGKTVIFSYVLKNSKVPAIMTVRGRKLVQQASERLDREGVAHGVLMQGHLKYHPELPIQICSIDTLLARKLTPEAKLIVIDEAHLATSPGYRSFLERYPGAFILGVTATPYTEKTLEGICDVVVHPINHAQLVKEGYLVPARYFAPSAPDVSGVAISRSTKDFVPEQLEAVMDTPTLTGDIVSHWKKLGKGPTLCFAVSVPHSEHIAASFNAAGIPARHMDAFTPDPIRNDILRALTAGEIKVVSNVGVLSTGVDIPSLQTIILARPTKSYSLYIQQLGRGTRPYPDKKEFIVLDHAGNIHRHGFIEDEEPARLTGRVARKTYLIHTCRSCFAVYTGSKCPACETPKESVGQCRVMQSVDGELTEITKKEKIAVDTTPALAYYDNLLLKAKTWGFKRGWVFFELKKVFGADIAATVCKQRGLWSWGIDPKRTQN